tara:strand:+ start:335 stop:796 length:462 start_codon:yes stop_codon:yes gene_type:complete
MVIYFFKPRVIFAITIIFFIFVKQSYSNEFDNVSACAGVIMGEGATELRDLQNEENFDDAFELAIKAFYGEGLSKKRSEEDIVIAENIIASNVDKIYMQPEWTAEVYEEVIRCYRILGLKVLEKSNLIKNNINMINQYINKYKLRFKRMINAG